MRFFRDLSLAALATLLVATTANGDGFVRMSDGGSGFNGLNPSGGAFVGTTASPGGFIGKFGGPNSAGSPNQSTSFLTFCIERNEHVTLGNATSGNDNLYFAKLRNGAANGGNAGGNPDPVGEATALLYRQFRSGLPIAGYLIDGNSSYIAASQTLAPSGMTSALQFAVWYLEQEFGTHATPWTSLAPSAIPAATSASFAGQDIASGALNTQYKTAAANMVNWARTNAQAGQFYGVSAMQLWGYSGSGSRTDSQNYNVNSQDQLTLVPLPLAAWMGISLLASVRGMTYLKKRRVASSNEI